MLLRNYSNLVRDVIRDTRDVYFVTFLGTNYKRKVFRVRFIPRYTYIRPVERRDKIMKPFPAQRSFRWLIRLLRKCTQVPSFQNSKLDTGRVHKRAR